MGARVGAFGVIAGIIVHGKASALRYVVQGSDECYIILRRSQLCRLECKNCVLEK